MDNLLSETSLEGFENVLEGSSILVIDDEPGIRHFIQKQLSSFGARIDVASNTKIATNLLDDFDYDLILLDNILPDQKGLDWLSEQKRVGLYCEAILMTAYADLGTAIEAIRAGASDFLVKPFRSNQILNVVVQNLTKSNLRKQNSILRNEIKAGEDLLRQRNALIGTSKEIENVRSEIKRAAKIDAHVVISGEVGSGKQIAARMLHDCSPRSNYPFVWLQCNGLNDETFKSNLFGQIDSNFNYDKTGLLADAKGGTLFLEDVELLTPTSQNILVELLTTGRFKPLGAARNFSLDVRIVCSTTKSLFKAVEENLFRADLYYLLNIHEIVLPPLRERPEDIVLIAEFFLEKLQNRIGITAPEITASIRRRLMSHEWLGNVMELRNAVERALIRGTFDTVIDSESPSSNVKSLAAVEKRHFLTVLEECSGNRNEAARRLGVARKTIDRKCNIWGV